MGNLNSRESIQLLDSPEFKHVCQNLGYFFREQGDYMHRRKRASRKHGEGSHGSHLEPEETNRKEMKHGEKKENRDKEKSKPIPKDLNSSDRLRTLNWECPSRGDCPWNKFIDELLRKNPQLNALASRQRNGSQDHHRSYNNERRQSTPNSSPRRQRRSPSGNPRAPGAPPIPQNGTLHPLLSMIPPALRSLPKHFPKLRSIQ